MTRKQVTMTPPYYVELLPEWQAIPRSQHRQNKYDNDRRGGLTVEAITIHQTHTAQWSYDDAPGNLACRCADDDEHDGAAVCRLSVCCLLASSAAAAAAL